MELLIGPRTYSTWSLRGWLVMRATGAPFAVVDARYETEADRAELRRRSPSGFVPLLTVDGEAIWDTLSIAEWAHERFPEAGLWPADPMTRALARSATAEMHSGFMALRTHCGMGSDRPLVGDSRSETPSHPDLDRDLSRIVGLVRQMRERFGGGGPFMFGAWSIADALHARGGPHPSFPDRAGRLRRRGRDGARLFRKPAGPSGFPGVGASGAGRRALTASSNADLT